MEDTSLGWCDNTRISTSGPPPLQAFRPLDNAQIFSFKVITEEGSELRPYDLPDAEIVYYFDVQMREKRLRFEIEKSSGGNIGVVEIEAYAR